MMMIIIITIILGQLTRYRQSSYLVHLERISCNHHSPGEHEQHQMDLASIDPGRSLDNYQLCLICYLLTGNTGTTSVCELRIILGNEGSVPSHVRISIGLLATGYK
jgi:hypothetical protein